MTALMASIGLLPALSTGIGRNLRNLGDSDHWRIDYRNCFDAFDFPLSSGFSTENEVID
jgi:hypothetical protein